MYRPSLGIKSPAAMDALDPTDKRYAAALIPFQVTVLSDSSTRLKFGRNRLMRFLPTVVR